MPTLKALKARNQYGTRRLQAGDEFEMSDRSMARAMIAAGLAEAASEKPQAPTPAAYKPAKAAQPEPDEPAMADEADDDIEDKYSQMSRAEMLAEAEKRGVEFPAGYVSRANALQALRSRS